MTLRYVRHILSHMKTATVRELRNDFPRIEALVREGETVAISKRGQVIATLVPAGAKAGAPTRRKPDIMARLKKNWGRRVFSQAEVEAMRAAELEGEEG